MAEMIPPTVPLNTNTGEKLVFRILQEALQPNSEYLVWHEPNTPDVKSRPDFLVWSQEIGLLVIEVKGWQLGDIREFGTNTWRVNLNGVVQPKQSPTEQARKHQFDYKDYLTRTTEFQQPQEHTKAGMLKFPVHHCVAFTNIRQSEAGKITKVLGEDLCLFQDDLSFDTANPEARKAFAEKLRKAVKHGFRFAPLTPAELQLLRHAISPVYQNEQAPAGTPRTPTASARPMPPNVQWTRPRSRLRGWALIALGILGFVFVSKLHRPPATAKNAAPQISAPPQVVPQPPRPAFHPHKQTNTIPAPAPQPASLTQPQPSAPVRKQSSPALEESSQASTLIAVVGDVRFISSGCTASGDTLRCPFSVRSTREEQRLSIFVHPYVSPHSRMIDDQGHEYVADHVRLGSVENIGNGANGVSAQNTLTSDVPLSGEVQFTHVAPNLSSISLLEIGGELNNKSFKVQFRRVPLV